MTQPGPDAPANPPGLDPRPRARHRAALIIAFFALDLLVLGGVAIFLATRGGPSPAAAPAGAADVRTAEAVLESVQTYVREGETARARAVLAAATAAHPGDADLRLAYAQLLLTIPDIPAALEQYETAIDLGETTAAVRFAAGVAASQVERHARAAEHFQAACELDAGNADYAMHWASALLHLNRRDAAKAQVLRAGVLDPSRAVVWGQLAQILLDENNADMARQHAARARELQPAVAAWRVLEARALKRLGDPEAALLLLDPLNKADRAAPAVARVFAECYGLLGRPGDALAAVEAAARAAGTDAALWREAAAWATRAGDAEAARRHEMVAASLSQAAAPAEGDPSTDD